ncbi:MAG: polysaccharide deacetylase family protein [Planctomycetota bacterium]|nr:polysaccharide deacetylase family protein [Planctomycetota bacterium]
MKKTLEKIPDRTVALSFDDGCLSDLTVAAPMLREMGFGGTFYVSDAFYRFSGGQAANYVSWDQARELEEMGFEIGNHGGGHRDCSKLTREELIEEVEYVEAKCREHGISQPVTFAYPGYAHGPEIVAVLKEKGYRFARRGPWPECSGEDRRGPAYDPRVHEPLLVPTTGGPGPGWEMKDILWLVEQARDGKIAVLNYHGAPDVEHPWVNTDPEAFRDQMRYLKQAGCMVISMRDLGRFVDAGKWPDA